MYHKLIFPLLLLVFMAACIRKEAPNAEADIEGVILPPEIAVHGAPTFLPYNEEMNAYPVLIEVKPGTDLAAIAPTLHLSDGATVQPASGTAQDFRRPVRYHVTSEDGMWHRTYMVQIHYPVVQRIPTKYHFDNVYLNGSYYVFREDGGDEFASFAWASGNPGFAWTGSNYRPEDFPTSFSEKGYRGNCVKLTTCLTGELGQKVNMPIAAGNLFMGRFDLLRAMSSPLSATQFGVPFYQKPIRLKGYYKYQPGQKYYDLDHYTQQRDACVIYAMLFDNDDKRRMMDGHLAVTGFDNDHLVALAYFTGQQAEEWTTFSIPFDYGRYKHGLDLKKLASGGYSLSIVMSSSIHGDRFRGAPGSTLWVDELELVCE